MALLAYVLVGEAENVRSRRAVGRYRLYGEIAAGGMATVHYGRMQAPLGFARTVAIKRLHREYARDPEFVAMFMDEARLAARVHHRNVVQTLDVVAADGELFLVMEYVAAVSLSELLRAAQARRERLPPAVAAAVVAGLLAGLHAAHEATDEQGNPLDIVHRDVSPQNVLVGADGCARVLDFGIAKATGRQQTTREGQLKGKFAYMAPEQITNVCVTRQSDVFAASIVLWEALTGARLFQAESEPSLLARVLTAPIDPPSAVVPELGGEFDAVVLRGLSRDLSVRFASARDMASDLEVHARLASATAVGEWVERLAGEELAQRAARVAEIENESRSERVSVAAVLATSLQPPQHGPTNAKQVGSGRWRERRNVGALAAAASLALAAVGVGILYSRGVPVRAAGQHAVPPAPSATVPPAEPVLAETRVSPAPPASVSALAPSAITVRPARASDTKAAASHRTEQGAALTQCDPPYYVDSKGHLIYKSECFH